MSAPALIVAAPASGAGKTIADARHPARPPPPRAARSARSRSAPTISTPPSMPPPPAGLPTIVDSWAMRFETLAGLIEESRPRAAIAGRRRRHGPVRWRRRRHRLDRRHRGPVRPAGRARGRCTRHGRVGGGADRRLPPPSRRCRASSASSSTGSPAAAHAELLAPRLLRARLDAGPGHARRATATLALPSRHLGLVQAAEHADLGAVHRGARPSSSSASSTSTACCASRAPAQRLAARARHARPLPALGQRIAVARDEAFAFAYPAVLDGWRRQGAELTAVLAAGRRAARRRAPTPSTCPAAIPSCTPARSPAMPLPRRACAPPPGGAPSSTANAAATWCSAGADRRAPAPATRWPGCCRSSPASPRRRLHLGYRQIELSTAARSAAAGCRVSRPRVPLCPRDRARRAGPVPGRDARAARDLGPQGCRQGQRRRLVPAPDRPRGGPAEPAALGLTPAERSCGMKRRAHARCGHAQPPARLPRRRSRRARTRWNMVMPWPRLTPGVGVAAEQLRRAGRRHVGRPAGDQAVRRAASWCRRSAGFDAVQSGAVQIAHGTPYYWAGKSPALHWFTGVPFGLTAPELAAWIYLRRGRQALARDLRRLRRVAVLRRLQRRPGRRLVQQARSTPWTT